VINETFKTGQLVKFGTRQELAHPDKFDNEIFLQTYPHKEKWDGVSVSLGEVGMFLGMETKVIYGFLNRRAIVLFKDRALLLSCHYLTPLELHEAI